MKILMLGWELPPYNSGGLGVACYHLCKALSARGADIDFILPYEGDHGIDFMNVQAVLPLAADEMQKIGFAYESFKYTTVAGQTVDYPTDLMSKVRAYGEAAAKITELGQYDVIHAHDWLTLRAAIRLKQQANLPLIVHIHATEYDRAGGKRGNPLVHEIEETGMLMADRIIAVSDYTKQVIVREYGIPAHKVEVIHNSVDSFSYEPLDDDNAYTYLELLKRQNWRVVASVGRLTIQKGLIHLFHAMKTVVEHNPKTMLLVVGSGEQRQELIELSAELGIGHNVLFTDFQRGKRWRDAFAIADLYVLPSVSEPFGLTPLEAIGYGTPVLVSRQSGVAEVIQNCLKVDFWDVREMANQITAVVQNDGLRDELHKQSYTEYQRLSWHDTAEKLTRVYDNHLAEVVS